MVRCSKHAQRGCVRPWTALPDRGTRTTATTTKITTKHSSVLTHHETTTQHARHANFANLMSLQPLVEVAALGEHVQAARLRR